MHPVLRIILGIVVLMAGLYALFSTIMFIRVMINIHPVVRNGGYTTDYLLRSGGMLAGGLVLTGYFFYRAYKLLKPRKKEAPIELLGEEF
ncbi:hypothetical protein HF324_18890 [Chitinophaga oryzae]|uniref:Uncharacterized protein n=1 Tax=Chitinophaga oryzae TaxID=2725414 RepID=A0AAE6ZHK8_9BACT|nr:hypothetical protein [Chitinophaga oryzae]QJB33293.1 hypothetical protein HF329_19025 [Chitinophaga oryzae]QJB39813.1 hypothetical protein HF324_18890 [Chitinophaga oryzae]